MDVSNAQQNCNSAALPHQLTEQQTAVITIGRLLVAYRITGRPEQRSELCGMARMALALGAIDAATHAHLLELVSLDCIPNTPTPHPLRRTTACRPAGQEVH